MSEIWARSLVVAIALVVVGAVVFWQRARSRRARNVPAGDLGAGVYLLTSSSCPTCGSARRRVTESLGEEGFVEVSWESDPGVFQASGIDAVPALLVVASSGQARLFPGVSGRALASL